MTRTNIINLLIEKKGYRTYLEIGVFDPELNFNHIHCKYKIGVDPGPKSRATYIRTSDQFFKWNEKKQKKFDIIFIDGLHLDFQVLKDVENSLKFLNEGGTIITHDNLPANEYEQTEEIHTGAWMGTCWKATARLRMTRRDLEMYTVDTDCGCGIIRRGNQELFTPAKELSEMNYQFFQTNKKSMMNIISVKKFRELYG